MTPRPELNSRVHWVSMGSQLGEFPSACCAADVTEILPPEPGADDVVVSLLVKRPFSVEQRRNVTHDPGDEDDQPSGFMCGDRDYPPGTWHWPPGEQR